MSPARTEGFAGDLEALSVVDIVQTLSLGGKTARLLVSGSSRRGEIWFQDGVVTHAAAGRLLGDLAVYSLIEVISGQFVVEYGVSTETRSITQDTTFLVLEGLRRIDERSSEPSSSSHFQEVRPVLEADVRLARSRRRALGLIACGVGAIAIVAACLHDWRGPSATDAVAAVVPAPAPAKAVAPRPAPQRSSKRSASSRPAKAQPVHVEPPAPVAPESPAAEEPVPIAAAVVAPPPVIETPAPQTAAVDEPPRLLVSGKSGADGGTLTVVVDGKPAYTHQQLDKDKPFQAAIVLTPGEHVIVARLENGSTAGVHEATTRSVFVSGESQLLRITANRTFGSPVKVKLDRLPPRG